MSILMFEYRANLLIYAQISGSSSSVVLRQMTAHAFEVYSWIWMRGDDALTCFLVDIFIDSAGL